MANVGDARDAVFSTAVQFTKLTIERSPFDSAYTPPPDRPAKRG